MCIHNELMEMRKALDKAITPTERYRNELWEANKKLHENAWCATQQNDPAATNTEATKSVSVAETTTTTTTATTDNAKKALTITTRDIATSTTNLIHLTTNGTNPNDDNVADAAAADHHHYTSVPLLNAVDQDQQVNSFELIDHLQSNDSDPQQQHSHVMQQQQQQQQIKSIIEDNINLRIR